MDDACRGCGNDIVHDLRESKTRYMFADLEARFRSKQHGRCIKIGAVAGVVALFIMVALMFTSMGSNSEPDRPVSAAVQRAHDRAENESLKRWVVLVAGVTGSVAAATMGAATAVLARRRKFPYLDEYDG